MRTTTDARHVLDRLQAVETDAVEAMRAARYALDDLAVAHERTRQLQAELAALLAPLRDASASYDPSVSGQALVVEHGPCGRPEVVR